MNNNILKIRTLVDRFFDGETTLSEEQELLAWFRDTHELPEDLKPLREMFLDLDAVQCVALPTQPKEQVRTHPRRWAHWSVAAAVAVMVAVPAFLIVTSPVALLTSATSVPAVTA